MKSSSKLLESCAPKALAHRIDQSCHMKICCIMGLSKFFTAVNSLPLITVVLCRAIPLLEGDSIVINCNRGFHYWRSDTVLKTIYRDSFVASKSQTLITHHLKVAPQRYGKLGCAFWLYTLQES